MDRNPKAKAFFCLHRPMRNLGPSSESWWRLRKEMNWPCLRSRWLTLYCNISVNWTSVVFFPRLVNNTLRYVSLSILCWNTTRDNFPIDFRVNRESYFSKIFVGRSVWRDLYGLDNLLIWVSSVCKWTLSGHLEGIFKLSTNFIRSLFSQVVDIGGC